MATVIKAYNGASRIFAKDCSDIAAWVPEGGSIPLQDGVNDFTRHAVDSHKLAVFVKLDDDFVHDAAFSLEDYLTDRLAENFAKSRGQRFCTRYGRTYADRHSGRYCRCRDGDHHFRAFL